MTFSDPDILVPELCFDYSEWAKPEVHAPFFTDREVYHEHCHIHNDFRMAFRSTVETEEELAEVMLRIPHSSNFKCIVVE